VSFEEVSLGKTFGSVGEWIMSMWFYDTSTDAATGAVPLWFFCWRGTDRTRCWLSRNTEDTKVYVVRAAGA
jgi:hypothetical protein